MEIDARYRRAYAIARAAVQNPHDSSVRAEFEATFTPEACVELIQRLSDLEQDFVIDREKLG
jgi:hypothetical protein